eukprot:TRINITY_DN22544_c0_g1_i3.p1 TRINITY_DN22544_c0_g1~~TRINITY_DN22544_c0_g1_i3.p1  ORF type:complete len:144 (-),score=17.92 TRINITY_DN22544_c0_g1_i3:432-863(-)
MYPTGEGRPSLKMCTPGGRRLRGRGIQRKIVAPHDEQRAGEEPRHFSDRSRMQQLSQAADGSSRVEAREAPQSQAVGRAVHGRNLRTSRKELLDISRLSFAAAGDDNAGHEHISRADGHCAVLSDMLAVVLEDIWVSSIRLDT